MCGADEGKRKRLVVSAYERYKDITNDKVIAMEKVLEINRTVVVYLPTYISMHRTRVEFLVP